MASRSRGKVLHICEKLYSRERRVFTSVLAVSVFLGADRRTLQEYRERVGLFSKGGWVVIFDACKLDVQ